MAFETSHLFDLTSTSIDLEYWNKGWGLCGLRNVGLPSIPGFWGISKRDIVSIPQAASFLGFVTSPDRHEQARELMRELEAISPAIAKDHGQRSTALQDLQFRLITPYEEQRREDPHERSYVALSYRWSNPASSPAGGAFASTTQAARVAEEQGNTYDIHTNFPFASSDAAPTAIVELPIPAIFYKALLNERISEQEGIWIDQLCINQDDETEKRVAIRRWIWFMARLESWS